MQQSHTCGVKYLSKSLHKIEIWKRIETIAIILANIEMQHIVFAI